MSGLTIPLIVAIVAVVIAFMAYRGIRRGGARHYTLEREALLRRSSYMLMGAVILFLMAVGLLAYDLRQRNLAEMAESGAIIEGFATATFMPTLGQFPPTPTPTPTPDPNQPTITPTLVLRRALVGDTFGNGLTLRDVPNGERIDVLPEGSAVTLLDDEPVETGGYVWVRVRTAFGEQEGWVAQDFLITSENP